MKTQKTEKVLVDFMVTESKQNIALLRLNKPKALNAIDLDMVQSLQRYLDAWRDDDSIAAVFIDSEGDKAFCAGGDIVSLYRAMNEQSTAADKSDYLPKVPEFIKQFFTQEYRLDYAIHTYPKPLIAWGNGIIMGGGLGLFAAAKHKVVTPSAHIAMPEITIGLFPDVGASYFLNKMPAGVGKLLGLSAIGINSVDCVNIGLANYELEHQQKCDVLSSLSSLSIINNESVSTAICALQAKNKTQKNESRQGKLDGLKSLLVDIEQASSASDVDAVLSHHLALDPDNRLLVKANKSFKQGSPITANIFLQQLSLGKYLPLHQCFAMELSMAFECGILGEFEEGIRALLIDKDNKPKWLYAHHADVPKEVVAGHFTHFEHSSTRNPLSDLVEKYGTTL